ncbi:MAG TPA: D-mannonate dehydratase ManD [Terracidiphilus sp.]|nr:D-mannonate dehydratase ManD [Terracidiphilus sp.]
MAEIVEAKVIVTCPARNFVTLKIVTADGLHGLGDGTLNGRELAVAAYLEEHIIPCLIGRDSDRIEDTWQYFYRGAYWRRGPVTMAAIAAVDVALWDLKAKRAGMPLYQLLGGRCREGVTVYAHANGHSIEDLLESVAKHREMGYKAIRVQAAVPGVPDAYGVPHGTKPYEPAHGDRPREETWSTPKYLAFMPKMMEAVRSKFGFDLALLHDAHHRLTPIEAAALGKSLEEFRLFWLEDATPAENQQGFRLIRRHTTTPLAAGEVFNSIFDCKQLIEEQLIDYIRATATHAGGITHLRRIAGFADLYGVRTGCHGATDLSPVCMGAALHFDLSVPNFGIQEHMPHAAITDEVFPHAYTFANGMMHPGEAAGHGVEIDEKLAAKFPYRKAYLPVCRLEDGTMHNW